LIAVSLARPVAAVATVPAVGNVVGRITAAVPCPLWIFGILAVEERVIVVVLRHCHREQRNPGEQNFLHDVSGWLARGEAVRVWAGSVQREVYEVRGYTEMFEVIQKDLHVSVRTLSNTHFLEKICFFFGFHLSSN
jgi:hypothetical protein